MDVIHENIVKLESGQSIDELERNVINLVLNACSAFDNVIARIAGGWVRDKVLGIQSNDIDLAIEGISSRNFGDELVKQAKDKNPKAKSVVIAANPEMSKHMETVRVCLFPDYWVDICNLRPKEINSTDFGTPEDDAKRRDFTINALFFNVNTNKIEDHVNGVEDIRNHIIRTPISPFLTFSEDPLRIIRGFRFASKYKFEIDSSIFETIPLIKDMFEKNVAQERISTEIVKSFETSSPISIINLIIQSTLFNSIFDVEKRFNIDEKVASNRISIAVNRCSTPEMVLVVLLCAIYFDVSSVGLISDPMKPKKKLDPIEYAIGRVLKLSLKIANDASALLKSEKRIEQLPNNLNRISVGHWIREIGANWKLTRCIIFDENILNFYDNVLVDYIEKEKMEELISMKPLVDGRKLADIHNIKPGPMLKQLQEELIDWQIMHPNSPLAEYEEYVKTKQ